MPPVNGRGMTKLSAHVPQSLREEVLALCEQHGMSINEMVRRAITYYLAAVARLNRLP